VARHDTAASVTPATAADRIDGLDAVRDYITRLDFMTRKQKLALPPSWALHPRTPERADAAEAKYKKWLLLQRKHEDVALSPGPPGELDIVWHFHILDTEAIFAIFGRYLHRPPDFGSMGNAVPRYRRRLFRGEYGEE
jgi:hypothetical protein